MNSVAGTQLCSGYNGWHRVGHSLGCLSLSAEVILISGLKNLVPDYTQNVDLPLFQTALTVLVFRCRC